MNIEQTQTTLKRAGVTFSPGLTSSEVEQVEERYGFSFPPDLKNFLMSVLPVSTGFVDWRNGNPQEILSHLSWPYEGICFDIEHSGFWLPKWGKKPLSLNEAFATAKREIDSAPTLIPIYSHRYIPDSPAEAGNPIFSVYQTDIIYYGADLFDYLQNEFSSDEFSINSEIKRIEFWSEMVDLNNG